MNIDIRYPNSSVLSYKKKKFDVAEVVLNDANQTSNGKKKKIQLININLKYI